LPAKRRPLRKSRRPSSARSIPSATHRRGQRFAGADAGPADALLSGGQPQASRPEVVGVLAGPGTPHPPPDLRLYGTDLGLTYEHDGQLVIVFGDTWMTPKFVCDEPDPTNDDTMGTLPTSYSGGVPQVSFVTEANSPNDPAACI